MRAVVCQFNMVGNAYQKLLDVLINSWQTNATIPLKVLRVDPPKEKGRHWSYAANTLKLKHWYENFNQDTIFIDADMLLLDCIADGFDKINDVGVTDREGPIPINGGVLFVKYNKRGKAFMNDFVEINQQMFEDKSFHDQWLGKYAGMNQSAIGYLIENEYKDYTLLPDKYNCCDPWTNWEQAKMMHIKGRLRIYCVHNQKRGDEHLMQIKKIWNTYAN